MIVVDRDANSSKRKYYNGWSSIVIYGEKEPGRLNLNSKNPGVIYSEQRF
jgi:hypothetical protein